MSAEDCARDGGQGARARQARGRAGDREPDRHARRAARAAQPPASCRAPLLPARQIARDTVPLMAQLTPGPAPHPRALRVAHPAGCAGAQPRAVRRRAPLAPRRARRPGVLPASHDARARAARVRELGRGTRRTARLGRAGGQASRCRLLRRCVDGSCGRGLSPGRPQQQRERRGRAAPVRRPRARRLHRRRCAAGIGAPAAHPRASVPVPSGALPRAADDARRGGARRAWQRHACRDHRSAPARTDRHRRQLLPRRGARRAGSRAGRRGLHRGRALAGPAGLQPGRLDRARVRDDHDRAERDAGGPPQPVHGDPRNLRRRRPRDPVGRADPPALLVRCAGDALPRPLAGRARAGVGGRGGDRVAGRGRAARGGRA